jgi:hypothetical protein
MRLFGCGDIVGQRYRRILDYGDTVAVLLENLIDALPTGTVHKTTVNENDRYCRETRYSSHDDLLSSMIGSVVQTACQLRGNPRRV